MTKDNVSPEEFLKMFCDSVFVNLDETKEFPPRHTTSFEVTTKLNSEGKWGAYFTPNGFATFSVNRKRTIDHVTSLNAHFVEIDSPAQSPQETMTKSCALAETAGIPFSGMVLTGRGVHGYWVFKNPIVSPSHDQKADYQRVQDELTEMFGSDRQARDIARVLRIPGSKYWKDESGKEIQIGMMSDKRYDEQDFLNLFPQEPETTQEKKFLPMESVAFAKHGERHGKSFILALKLCNQFSDTGSREVAYAMYRVAIDKYFERVTGDDFHEQGGEADKQFEAAWERVQLNPRKKTADEPQVKKQLPGAVSFKDLMEREFPNPQWAIEKLFESGTINMISAQPNHYKSWVTLAIALACAKGEVLFGTFNTNKQSVMIVNEEDGPRMIQQRILLLGEAAIDLPIYFHVLEDFKLDGHGAQKLLDEIGAKGITMVIFDSLRSVHGGDENSSQEMQAVMDQLKKFTQKGVTVVFTHHNRKKPQIGGVKNDGEETRGSSAINAAVHGHLSLQAKGKKEEPYIVVRQQKLKGEMKIDPFELLVIKSPFGFVYRKYQEEGRDESTVALGIHETISAEDAWFSVADFVALGVGGQSRVRPVLKELVGLGKVEMKLRKEVRALGLVTKTLEGAPSQNLYHFIPEEASEEGSE